MHPLEIYLARLREIRSSGAAQKETSYYGALENLFNEIGKSLKPRVVCNMQLKDQGAGNPDGGLFTEEQLKTRKGVFSPLQQTPARGVIEIKSTSDDVGSQPAASRSANTGIAITKSSSPITVTSSLSARTPPAIP